MRHSCVLRKNCYDSTCHKFDNVSVFLACRLYTVHILHNDILNIITLMLAFIFTTLLEWLIFCKSNYRRTWFRCPKDTFITKISTETNIAANTCSRWYLLLITNIARDERYLWWLRRTIWDSFWVTSMAIVSSTTARKKKFRTLLFIVRTLH